MQAVVVESTLNSRDSVRGVWLVGEVKDTEGAPIAGALVKGVRTNKSSEYLIVKTDAYGRYKSNSLPDGAYQVSVQADGFTSEVSQLTHRVDVCFARPPAFCNTSRVTNFSLKRAPE